MITRQTKRTLMLVMLIALLTFCFSMQIFAGELARGDMDGDGDVDSDDAIYLLRHTLLPNEYPLACDCETTIDGGTVLTGTDLGIAFENDTVVAESIQFGAKKMETFSRGDMDGDGDVDSDDAIYLLRHTLLPNEYPLTCDHEIVIDRGVAPTCTEPGITEGSHCSLCRKVLTEQTEISALGHTFEGDEIVIEGTCTKPGVKKITCVTCGECMEEEIFVPHTTISLGNLADLTFVDGKIQTVCVVCKQTVDMTAEVRFQLDFEEADRTAFLALTDPIYGIEMGTYTGTANKVFEMKKYANTGRTVLRLKDNESVIVKFNENLLSDTSYYMITFDWRLTLLGQADGVQYVFGLSSDGGLYGTKSFFSVNRGTGVFENAGGKTMNSMTAKVDRWYSVAIVADNISGAAYIYIDGVLFAYHSSGFAITEGVQAEDTKLGWFLGGQFNTYHKPEFDNFKIMALDTFCDHDAGSATCTEDAICSKCGAVVEEKIGHLPLGEISERRDSTCLEAGYVVEVCGRAGCNGIVTELAILTHDISVENATEYKAATCTEEGSATGFCKNGCGEIRTVVIEKVSHQTHDLGDLARLSVVNGTIYTKCIVCGQSVEVPEDVRLALDFDKASLADEVAEWANADNALSVFESMTNEYYHTKIKQSGDRSVLHIPHNSSAMVTFNAALLEDADYYMISFDWRATEFDETKVDTQGVFGLSRVDFGGAVRTTDYVALIHRGNGTFVHPAGKSLAPVAKKGQWYSIALIVNNTTGNSYLYIDGVCYASYANENFKIAASTQGVDRMFAWKFGGVYNVAHKPEFDNFKISVFDTGHSYVDLVCIVCGAHKPSEGLTFTSNGDGTCYVSGIGACTDTQVFIPTKSPMLDVVTGIGKRSFSGCENIVNVVIPDGVTDIGANAFQGCVRMESATISASVTSVGSGVFAGCTSLTNIVVDADNQFYKAMDGDLYTKDGKGLIQYAVGKPESSYSVPTGVERIGGEAFCGSENLTRVIVAEGVTVMGDGVFSGCDNITSVTILGNITEIGNYAFYSCNRLVDITIPQGVTSIGTYAFGYCDSLVHVTLPDSLGKIGDRAFYSCDNLEEIILPTNVTSIGDGAFYYCGHLTSVVIPDCVTRIGANAFWFCGNLTDITMGSGIKSIGYSAFYGCDRLENVYISDLTAWCKILFGVGNSNPLSNGANLYVKGILVENLVLPDNLTGIRARAFQGCKSITSVTIPNRVASIGAYVFQSCSRLETVVLGNGVVDIGSYAFYACDSLVKVTLPESVANIGRCAFLNCSSLTGIVFSDPSAWYATNREDYTNGSAVIVVNSRVNVTYFQDTYKYCCWYKE